MNRALRRSHRSAGGGQTLVRAAVAQHPLGPPTVNGDGTINVPLMLQQPTRITRMISDMTRERFLLDFIFTNAGGVTGGAVVYDWPTQNDIYPDRDVERIAPGAEFPIITTDGAVPRVAEVEKWGAKTFITDEARDRNLGIRFAQEIRKLGNAMVRKINQRSVEVMEAAITANGGASEMVGHNWNAVVTAGASESSATAWPAATFSKLQLAADLAEPNGVRFDLLIIHPNQMAQLALLYESRLQAVLAAYGLRLYVSTRVASGTALAVASGQVGEYRVEKALGTETWREQKTERTWVQSSVRPMMYVLNPYALMRITGLAG